MSLFFIRHGERMDHVDHHWALDAPRPWDPPLSLEGEAQAKKTGVFLRNAGGVDVIYCSPFLRCLQTAALLIPFLEARPPVRVDDSLSEYLGAEMFPEAPVLLSREEMGRLLPSLDTDYTSRPVRHPEPFAAMEKRFRTAALRLAREHEGERVAVVTHAYGMAHLPQAFLPSMVIKNPAYCSVTHLERRAGQGGARGHPATSQPAFEAVRAACPLHWKAKKGVISRYYVPDSQIR